MNTSEVVAFLRQLANDLEVGVSVVDALSVSQTVNHLTRLDFLIYQCQFSFPAGVPIPFIEERAESRPHLEDALDQD